MSTNTKPAVVFLSKNGKIVAAPPEAPAAAETAQSTRKAVAAQPKPAQPVKTSKASRRPPQSARATSTAEKLVCRYCGSDDLAPSFIKRRDARCRACFKQRYGSAAQTRKDKRARKAKAAK